MAKLLSLGGAPMNEGESIVVRHLQEHLPNSYTLFPNTEIIAPGRPPYEYDLIVLAPHALYVVEIKQWRGGIRGDDHTCIIAGQHRRPNPYTTTNNKARVLKSQIERLQPGIRSIWVQAIVAIADMQGEIALQGESAKWICQYSVLPELLCNPNALPFPTADLRLLRGPLESTLQRIGRGQKSGPRKLGEYEIVETLSRGDHVSEYLAKHTLLRNQEYVRLRAFSYNPYLPPDQLTRRGELIRREAETLQKIGGHPNLITVSDLRVDPNDPNLYFLVTDWSEMGTLRDLLNSDTPLSLERKLELAQGMAAGLQAVHQVNAIHRDMRPENILITPNGQPKLMNFDYARLPISGFSTVGPISHDPDVSRAYLAPELLNPANSVTSAADIYGFGCILFEMLVGQLLYDSPEDARQENTSAGGPVALGVPDIPLRLNELVRKMTKPDPQERPQSIAEVISELKAIRAITPTAASITTREPAATMPVHEEVCEPHELPMGYVINDKYQVHKKLGAGGFGQVYKVYDEMWDSVFALKLFQGVDGDRVSVRQEIQSLKAINHPHVARVHDWGVLQQSKRFYLVSEFIEGEELTHYTTLDHRLSIQEVVKAIMDLLDALQHIHPDVERIEALRWKMQEEGGSEEDYAEFTQLQHSGWLHRDIKPANLILAADGLKLVDFNIAAKAHEADVTWVGTPAYMLPETGMMRWTPDADLFATGVVLFELITGHHPYPERQPNADTPPTDPRDYVPDLHPALAEILQRAVSCQSDLRYHSARQLRQELLDVMEKWEYQQIKKEPDLAITTLVLEPWEQGKQNYNPYVTRLLTLYSQARRDNSGTRGLDDIAQQTYVTTRLDQFLQPAVLDGQYRLVIITGNAGDGKTAFIKNLEKRIEQEGVVIERPSANASQFQYNHVQFVTNYDGSQDEGADRANDQVLNEFFAPFADNAQLQPNSQISVHLIAINKGRVLDFFNDQVQGERFIELRDAINNFFYPETENGSPLNWLRIIDLNHRSVVARDLEASDKSIFERQLEALLDPRFWAPCQTCALQTHCFIKYNVDTFSEPLLGSTIRERLRTLFEVVHLRRKLHITMRDMRSALSWMLFRDHTCDDVAELFHNHSNPRHLLSLLYHSAFAFNGKLPAESHDDRLVRLLRQIDPAQVANPAQDMALHFRALNELNLMRFEGRSEVDSAWLNEWYIPTGWEAAHNVIQLQEHQQKHAVLRRITFFERRNEGWMEMLPYSQLATFRQATQGEAGKQIELLPDEEARKLKEIIVKGISLAEGARASELATRNICLRASQTKKVKIKSFRLFPATDFHLYLPRVSNHHRYTEHTTDQIIFRHVPQDGRQPHAELILSLDLLELLHQIANGFMPSADDLSGVFVNLTIFKNALAHLPYRSVLLTRDNQQFYELKLEEIATLRLKDLGNAFA